MDDQNMTSCVYVGNLPKELTQGDLIETINFKDLELLSFHNNGMKVFCFIDCGTHEKALEFCDKMNRFDIMGRRICVRLQDDKPKGSRRSENTDRYSSPPKKKTQENDEWGAKLTSPSKPSSASSVSRGRNTTHYSKPGRHQASNSDEEDMPALKPVAGFDRYSDLEEMPALKPISSNLLNSQHIHSGPMQNDAGRVGNRSLSCYSVQSPGSCGSPKVQDLHCPGTPHSQITCHEQLCVSNRETGCVHECHSRHCDVPIKSPSQDRVHPGVHVVPQEHSGVFRQSNSMPQYDIQQTDDRHASLHNDRFMSKPPNDYVSSPANRYGQQAGLKFGAQQPDDRYVPPPRNTPLSQFKDEYVLPPTNQQGQRTELQFDAQQADRRMFSPNTRPMPKSQDEYVPPPTNRYGQRPGLAYEQVDDGYANRNMSKSRDNYSLQQSDKFEQPPKVIDHRYPPKGKNGEFSQQSSPYVRQSDSGYVESNNRYGTQSDNFGRQNFRDGRRGGRGGQSFNTRLPQQHESGYSSNSSVNDITGYEDSHSQDGFSQSHIGQNKTFTSIPFHQRFPRRRGAFNPSLYARQPRGFHQNITYHSPAPRMPRYANTPGAFESRRRQYSEQVVYEDEEAESGVILSVTNFPFHTTEEMIYKLFEDFEPVEVLMVCNYPSEQGLTEAYVVLPNEDFALNAIMHLDNTQYNRRTLFVVDVNDADILEELQSF